MKLDKDLTDKIPETWSWSSLKDIIVNHDGKRVPVRKSDRAEMQGEYPYYGASGVIDHIQDFLFEGQYLLLAEDGANLLSRSTPIAFQAHGKFWVNNHAHIMQTKGHIPLGYIEHYLNSISLAQYTTGTAQPKLTQRNMNRIPIPVAPLAEQKRIVAEIETQFTRLDQATAALERLQKQLQRYRASVLKHACEGELVAQDPTDEPAEVLLDRILAERQARWEADAWQKEIVKAQKKAAKATRKAAGLSVKAKDIPDAEWEALGENVYGKYLPNNDKWKEKYQEPERPDPADLPELPAGWVWAKVQVVGDVQLGRQRSPKHHTGEHMRPYLRVANVFEDRIDTRDVMEMNFTPEEFKTYQLKYNDILLNEGQSLELVGRPAIFRDEVSECCFQNTLVRFRCKDALLPKYALHVFLSYLHSGRFQQIAQWTTSIAHLGAGRFSELEFPLPPFAEQERIIEEVERRLSLISSAQETTKMNLKRAQRLRQAILKRAFSGQLVPQDPNDEPAAELLKRIQFANNH